MIMERFILGLTLSLLAGLSTSIGSLIAVFIKKPNPRFISFIMGFSAGVMIFISFVELLQGSIETIGFLTGILFFFLGIVIMFIIDMVVSHEYEFEDSIEILINENGKCEPHLHYGRRQRHGQRHRGGKKDVNLVKSSLFIFFGVFIHNFPEGMATFIGTLTEVQLGISLAIAIALHNIPEGIAVAVPIYACT